MMQGFMTLLQLAAGNLFPSQAFEVFNPQSKNSNLKS